MVALGPPGPWSLAGDAAGPFPIELAAPPAVATMPRTLRVTTFNVEYSTRTGPLIAALRAHPEVGRSDVLLLQEVGPHRLDGARAAPLAEALGLGHAYAHGLAILCRWPLRDVAVMELPRARLPYNQRRRIALAAEVDTDAGPLRLMSVHLDTRLNRHERVLQLAPAVTDAHPLQIVGGDMNTLPFHFVGGAAPVYRADQVGLLDAYMRGLGFATPVSAAGATHRNVLGVRLDAVFTRGVVPQAARVARDVRVSDHFPVWADVELPAAGG